MSQSVKASELQPPALLQSEMLRTTLLRVKSPQRVQMASVESRVPRPKKQSPMKCSF